MTHLGDALSALVDGELIGAELDRANAHLAACADCRGEAAALRLLKTDLRMLGAAASGCPPVDELTSRLLALAGSSAPVPARYLRREPAARPRRTREHALGTRRTPASAPPGRTTARRRGRYAVWGALSLVVVGIGTAAFGMGGSGAAGSQVPKVTPQQLVEFDQQHAINAGDVPFAEPAGTAGAPAASPAEMPGKSRTKVAVEATTP
jgi:anti-sigma factor RsiW